MRFLRKKKKRLRKRPIKCEIISLVNYDICTLTVATVNRHLTVKPHLNFTDHVFKLEIESYYVAY